jgi:hypothetical protein
MQSKKFSTFTVFLFIYHLFFIGIAYVLRMHKASDAQLYWAQNFNVNLYSWSDFTHYGSDIIILFNYPFIKLGFPYWSGFLIYGMVGFLGILKWMDLAQLIFKDFFVYKKYNLLYVLFLLPNLHYWTASLGKEALVFWALASIFYTIYTQKFDSKSFIVGILLLLLIRPHILLMLISACALTVLFQKKYSIKCKSFVVLSAMIILPILVLMVFQLTKIKYWNWSRIERFNNYSIVSFRHSGSYVPMLEYNYFEKLFALNFRPFFLDASTIWAIFASIENMIALTMFCITCVILLVYAKKVKFPSWVIVIVVYFAIASLLYIQRYANLGIFMRTKIMYQPFLYLVFLYYFKYYISIRKQNLIHET